MNGILRKLAQKLVLLALGFLLALTACQAAATEAPADLPTATATATETPAPTPTMTPSPTPSPTVRIPVQPGTPVPAQALPLTAGNAGEIVELARWGRGTSEQVLLSPDGQILAVASSTGVYLFAFDSLEQIAFLDSTGWVNSIAFSADGTLLAVGQDDGKVLIWQASGDFPLLHTLEMDGGRGRNGIDGVAFAPDGRLAVLFDFGGLQLLDSLNEADLVPLAEWVDNLGNQRLLAVSPDGSLLAASDNKQVLLYSVAAGDQPELLRTLAGCHTRWITGLAFLPDGATIASSSADESVCLWRSSDGGISGRLQGGEALMSLAISPDGATIAAGGQEGTLSVWRLEDRTQVGAYELPGVANSLAFSPDGARIAVSMGWAWFSADGVQVRQVADGALAGEITGFASVITDIDISPDGRSLVSAAADNFLRVWDLPGGTILREWEQPCTLGDGISCVVLGASFSPDGQMIASQANLGADPIVYLWNAGDGSPLGALSDPNQTNPSAYPFTQVRVVFSPDGSLVAAGSKDNLVRLWDVASGRLLRTYPGYDVRFSPDGTLIVLGTSDGWVLRQVSDGHIVYAYRTGMSTPFGMVGVHNLAFSPDGTRLLGPRGELWTVPEAYLAADLASDSLNEIVFSPDGQLVASSSEKGTISLWLTDGTLVRTWQAHAARSSLDGLTISLAFSPDGSLLASAANDGTIRLWGTR